MELERDKWPTLLVPILAVKQISCFSCWKPEPHLKRCTACKRVSYCSPECQKKDWNSSHKKTCKFLVASNKKRMLTPATGRNWDVFYEEKV
jgi:mitochondrial splicing suppressor protein 51